MAEQDNYYHKVIDDLYAQVVDHDRPRGSQFDYCEDITEKYIDKMSDIELQYWYDTYIAPCGAFTKRHSTMKEEEAGGNVRSEMVQLAQRIRDAGDELHDLAVELADNIARTDPDDTYLDFIMAELEKSDNSTDVAAHLVASGIRAILMFDAVDTTVVN